MIFFQFIFLPLNILMACILMLVGWRRGSCFYSPLGISGSLKNLYDFYAEKGEKVFILSPEKNIFSFIKNAIFMSLSHTVFLTHGIGGLPLNIFMVKRVQIWHGIPLKKILLDNENDCKKKMSYLYYFLYKLRIDFSYSYLITGYGLASATLSNAFGFNEKKTLCISGYVHPNVSSQKDRDEGVTIDYLPTWREDETHTEILFNTIYDIHLDRELERIGKKLIIRPHPYDSHIYVNLEKENKNFNKLKNISLETGRFHLRPGKVIITDYSSIMFEALHYDVNTILFCPDLHSYVSTGRELYDYFYSIARVESIAGLVDAIEKKKYLSRNCFDEIYSFEDNPAEKIYAIFR